MGEGPDLTIIGAGPAGLFAAYQLSRLSPKTRILLLGGGYSPNHVLHDNILNRSQRSPVNVDGIGGSGIFADKLYFENAGGWLESRNPEYAQVLITYVAEIFERFGGLSERNAFALNHAPAGFPGLSYKPYRRLVPLRFDDYKRFLQAMLRKLKANDVTIRSGPPVRSVSRSSRGFAIRLENNQWIWSRRVLICTGRSSGSWFKTQAVKLGLKPRAGRPYLGIRIESKADLLLKLKLWGHDPKLKDDFSDTKTHCVCFGGHVISCSCDGMILVDGTTLDRPSLFSSLNILTRTTAEKARYAVNLILQNGNGQPTVQTMRDFANGTPSSRERVNSDSIRGTFRNVTPGEITRFLPPDVLRNISEFLEQMKATIPGVVTPRNLVYAPVFEWFSPTVSVKKTGETGVEGLFVAGDVASKSQGVVMAAASGLWTAIKIASLI